MDATIANNLRRFDRWVERKNISQNSYTQAVYAPDGSEAAVIAGSSVVSYYVHLPKGAMAVYGSGGAITTYWHPDWLGTARLMTSPGRSIVFDEDFGPFGELHHGPAADSFFTGVAQIPEAND